MKTLTKTLLAATVLTLGMSLNASSAFAMTSYQSAIDALRADTLSSSEHLRVYVEGDTAYLAGNADSAIEKHSAERALLNLEGITDVVNLISVN